MICLQLFRTFFLIGLFSFGGGYASMELIRSRVVLQQQWLTGEEFTDIISIAEMTPGPLGINIASFVGTRTAGIAGTVTATMAYVLPAMILVMLLAKVYYRYRSLVMIQGVLKGLRPAVAAMVVSAAVTLTKSAWLPEIASGSQAVDVPALLISAVCLILLRKKILGPVQTILVSGIAGALICGLPGL